MELTLSYFFFDLPIYSPFTIEQADEAAVWKIIDCTKREEFDGYNPWKKLESTFVVTTDLCPTGSDNAYFKTGGYGTVKIKCKRTDDIFWYYILWTPQKRQIQKIGQFPSVADFHISEIKQYSKLLNNERLREFTRAIGLVANGVGIGSFVYLRRIFEGLIDDAFLIAKNEGVVNEEDFKRARMDEKINLLASHLPNFLIENRSLYSILSLGIHQLNEKDCLAHFDTLRVGIEIILDEKLEDLQKKEKIEAAKHKLAALKGQLGR